MEDGRLRGTITNESDETISSPAVVLGGTVAALADLASGQTATVDVPLARFEPDGALADKVVGPVFFGDPSSAAATRLACTPARRSSTS